MIQGTAYISGTLLSLSFKSRHGGLETLQCGFFILYPASCSYPSVGQIEYCNKTMRNNNMCLLTDWDGQAGKFGFNQEPNILPFGPTSLSN